MAIYAEASYDGAQVQLPHTEAVTRDTLMLPLFADMSIDEQDCVLPKLHHHTKTASAKVRRRASSSRVPLSATR
jgi:hypothetical protein